jgi:hypothetical protein
MIWILLFHHHAILFYKIIIAVKVLSSKDFSDVIAFFSKEACQQMRLLRVLCFANNQYHQSH